MSMKISQEFTQNKALIFIGILVVFVCFFAVYLRLFTGKELWYEMFAAVLGVIITAVITMVLLRGQTNNDVERERDAKVFEEKLRIYQDFLQKLQDIIKDHALSDEEKILLQFQTSYVAMHCEQECIKEVSESVKKILTRECTNTKIETNDSDALLDDLFKIVEAFRKDLYKKEYHIQDDIKSTAVTNLKQACETKEIEIDENWNAIKSNWEKTGWKVNDISAQNATLTLRRNDGTLGSIAIATKPQGLCFQACYPNESDFSQPLKWQRSGYSNNGIWWKYFDIKYREISINQLTERLGTDKDLLQYVASNVIELQEILSDFQYMMKLKEAVGKYDGCKLFIWYWKILACNFEKVEGVPFLDIFEEGNKILICMGNREKNPEKLEKALEKIGKKNCIKKDHRYLLEEIATSKEKEKEFKNEIVDRIKYWINKINSNATLI